MDNDIYLRYFRYHHSAHGTVNNIGDNDVVVFEGQTLKIGWFKRTIRNKHNYYVQGLDKRACSTELAIRRYEVLDELGFEWTPQKKLKEEILVNDIYIRYLREYYKERGTINDISYTAVVEYDGKTVKIGSFIKSIRSSHSYFIRGIQKDQSFSEISVARYTALEEMEFCWNTRKEHRENLLEFDPYIEYLKEYYSEHGTINNISNRAVVVYAGTKLNIGHFLKEIRYFSNSFDPTKREYGDDTLKLFFRRKEILDSMNFEWNPLQKKEEARASYDAFIEYLRAYYSEFGTINNISSTTEVMFNGEMLKIGEFLRSMRYNHKFYVAGKKRDGCATETALRRYAALEEMGFIWIPDKSKEYTGFAKRNGLRPSTVGYLVQKFDGDVDKALKFSLLSKKRREESAGKKKSRYEIGNILDAFDIDLDSFIGYLNRPSLKTGAAKKPTVMIDKNMSLWEFCLNNGYNYDVILRIVRLKMEKLCDEDLGSLINRSVCSYKGDGQGRPATWIYSKYGNELLMKHLLISMNLDYASILRDMSHNSISLDEALERESFRKVNKREFNYLEGVYHEFVEFYRLVDSDNGYDEETASEALLKKADELIKEYHLTQEEFLVVTGAFQRYTNSLYQYRLYDVGFEKDRDKRLKKIIQYNFDFDDVQEAFFVPLKFDKKVLLGRDSELYQRRLLLKELTLCWHDFDIPERDDVIKRCNLTGEELTYVSEARQEIDDVKYKLFTKK